MAIWTIARLTMLEAARRRLLIALAILTLIVIGLMGFGFSKLPEAGGKTALNHDDVIQAASFLTLGAFFMFSFVLSFASVFVASPAISSDIDSGVILAMVPRPIRRSEIVLGRWLGLCVVVGVYATAATLLALEVNNLAVGFLPPHPFQAVAFLTLEAVVSVTLGLLLSTRLAGMTGGIIAIILLLAMWFAGVVGNIGYAFQNDSVTAFGTLSRLLLPTDGMWRGALFYLQSDQLVALQRLAGRRGAANPFYAPTPPTIAYLAYVSAWIAGMLGLAIWSFRKREL
ncbi:MAG: ABC transporter permease [Candidatus Dormibacteraceae bacterium]